jgi:CPA1 family monovalent cation:H+ antiporter
LRVHGLEVVVLIGLAVLVLSVLAQRLRVAPPLVLLLGGVAIGFVPKLGDLSLPPDVVLFLFLPALLYWESLNTSLREIRANLRVIVLQSVVLVIATAAAAAAVGHAWGLSWPMAFVLGAVVAPTDATAVSAVAGHLPRRPLTTLRAESLINDGTALVIYAVAVDAATGKHRPTPLGVSGQLIASYAGGIAIGIAVAAIVLVVRRRFLRDPHLENVLSVVTPFVAYLPAELAHVSGVVAVVTCGLALSQWGPRVIRARTRLQANAFWGLTTYLLNGALFVLVGLQLHGILEDVSSLSVHAAIIDGLVMAVVVVGVRLTWSNTIPFVIRALDRRPAQRLRRVGFRQRFPGAWAGFRGAVSLAAALAVPELRVDGTPLPGRDLILLVTLIVILVTLLIQGLTMPAVVRWARYPPDATEQQEQRLAERRAAEAGLAALDRRGAELGVPEHVVARIRHDYQIRLQQLDAEPDDEVDGHPVSDYLAERELRTALLFEKRLAVIALRDAREIDDTVLRRLQAQLDAEEVRLIGVSREE